MREKDRCDQGRSLGFIQVYLRFTAYQGYHYYLTVAHNPGDGEILFHDEGKATPDKFLSSPPGASTL